ncbi:hypothetical protein V2W45_1228160, partial [Cenococcum geophilum]
SKKIGKVIKTFNLNTKKYPNRYRNDVTLVKAFKEDLTAEVKSPIFDLRWLSCKG